jgi:hypothetical protein
LIVAWLRLILARFISYIAFVDSIAAIAPLATGSAPELKAASTLTTTIPGAKLPGRARLKVNNPAGRERLLLHVENVA